jgi:hypothetical protein
MASQSDERSQLRVDSAWGIRCRSIVTEQLIETTAKKAYSRFRSAPRLNFLPQASLHSLTKRNQRPGAALTIRLLGHSHATALARIMFWVWKDYRRVA